MRKITQNAVNAFMAKSSMSEGNTKVITENGKTTMYLHAHNIAVLNHETDVITIDACCWLTNTTKERLNGIPGVSISQKAYKWYLNDYPWLGNSTDLSYWPPVQV